MKVSTTSKNHQKPHSDSAVNEPVRRRGRPHRRQSLFSAVRAALAEKNIFDLTVDDIVQKAGVARGTFYIYFTDKFDILRAITEQLVEEQVEEQSQIRGKYENKMQELEESALRALRRWEQNAPVYSAVFQLAMIREDFHVLRDQLQAPLRARDAERIQAEVDAGRARPNLDTRVIAAGRQRMYELIAMEWFAWKNPPYEEATVEDVAKEFAKIWYHAIYPDESPTEARKTS